MLRRSAIFGDLEQLLDLLHIEGTKLVPFGDDHESVGTADRFVLVVGIFDAAVETMPRLVHRDRIVSPTRCAFFDHHLMMSIAGDSRMSSVSGLNESPRTPICLPLRSPTSFSIFGDHRVALAFVCLDHRVDDARLDAELVGDGRQRTCVFWKARAAVARAWMQEFSADAVVHSHAAGNIVNVAADRVAKIRDLVDERDLCREKRVSRVLDQLGRLERSDDDRRFDQIERPIKLLHYRRSPVPRCCR